MALIAASKSLSLKAPSFAPARKLHTLKKAAAFPSCSRRTFDLFHPKRSINMGPFGNFNRPGGTHNPRARGKDGSRNDNSPSNWQDPNQNPPQSGGFGGGGQQPPRMEAWVSPEAMPPGEYLYKFARDLTELAKAGKIDPVIGREEEIRRTIQVLSRRTKNNPVLIGEPGVGKTAIAEGLALRIINGEVPDSIKTKRVLALDLPALVAGTKFRGEFEERMRGILRDTQKLQGQIILFIDELHLLVGAGSAEGSMDASNMLKPALARGELHCVGATTLNEYRKYIEKDAALARRFQPVLITEPTVNDTISILRGLKEKYELHHGVRITDNALVSAAVLSNRYITDRFLPDKAIDLIDEAASRLRLQQESKPEALEDLDRAIITLKIEREALKKETDPASKERLEKLEADLKDKESRSADLTRTWHEERSRLEKTKKLKEEIERVQLEAARAQRTGDLARVSELIYGRLPTLKAQLPTENDAQNRLLSDAVTEKDISSVIARATGIPQASFAQGEKEKLLSMENYLSERVVGQQSAISAISNVVRIARAGLHAHTRPLGSFLFLGPTGVGKTELCKALAGFLFNTEQAMVRLDMSEYMEKHSVSRLIGAPPGYVGYEEGGALTEAVRRRPYAVILLDEFEKAHREVSNLMLQVLDEGRLTDSQGRTVDFRNTIIIMTSNLGAQHLAGLPEGAPSSAAQEFVMEDVRHAFPPEFLNRVDEIVLFNRLSREQMLPIVGIQLREISRTMEAKKIHLDVDEPTQRLLAKQGYDPMYGARPLKRVIQRMLLNPLSKLVLEGKILENDKVLVSSDAKQDVLTFKVVGRVKSPDQQVHQQTTKKSETDDEEQ